METTLGGRRLGSGKKNDIQMHGYSRSNHDLSYVWKSTMSAGTLVPFMCNIGLPGDTWDIKLDADVKTHPTLGPLFASFKLQLDLFTIPIRLYHKALHNNKLGIGMKMSQILLPQMVLSAEPIDFSSDVPPEFQQINQSSLLAYLGVRGLAKNQVAEPLEGFTTKFNAIPLLGYWDIWKNYYCNKMEDDGYVIDVNVPAISSSLYNGVAIADSVITAGQYLLVQGVDMTKKNLRFLIKDDAVSAAKSYTFDECIYPGAQIMGGLTLFAAFKTEFNGKLLNNVTILFDVSEVAPLLGRFDPKNIDTMRDNILAATGDVEFIINAETMEPYSSAIELMDGQEYRMKAMCPQSGLAVKTYQSDLFNNWLNTEMIEGPDSISEVTRISTTGDSFTLDTLNMSKKVYDMLNRIAVAGASYQDWLEAVYDHNSKWRAEAPVFQGGLSQEIIFQQIASLSATADEPLGSLAGVGRLTDNRKGGKTIINVDEPMFIMGIVSITPRISYSQGNEWWTRTINTLDDLHKPALDAIGFQDLITDQQVFWDTVIGAGGDGTNPVFKSAGKVPAWINYMTNIDKSYGNFADPRTQMFMTLDRRYKYDILSDNGTFDCTTYIDPARFNYAFAQTDLTAMNFWVQIANNSYVRRKMSAKVIPNL